MAAGSGLELRNNDQQRPLEMAKTGVVSHELLRRPPAAECLVRTSLRAQRPL